MVLELSPGWTLETEHGPGWMFIKLCSAHAPNTEDLKLADAVWELAQQEFCHRVVVEMDAVEVLHSHLIAELVRLFKRVQTRGGLLRLCGLSDANYEVIRTCRLSDCFPRYRDRHAAVMGHRPAQPR